MQNHDFLGYDLQATEKYVHTIVHEFLAKFLVIFHSFFTHFSSNLKYIDVSLKPLLVKLVQQLWSPVYSQK